MSVRVYESPAEFPLSRSGGWGLVPTMGALHEGHRQLIAQAAAENDDVVVSVFVNPAQFGNTSDLARYPRQIEADVRAAADAGATIIYAPTPETVYPPGFATWIEPGDLAARWEGRSRPCHFRGVATVVGILLNTVRPARSYFGEKDFQQLQIIRRMHRDLQLPGAIVGCPTVRDADGLALSSRNARLSASGRASAAAIPRALFAIAEAARAGITSAEDLVRGGAGLFADPAIAVDYLTIVDPETLLPVEAVTAGSRVMTAVEIDGVRLIDNVGLLEPTDP
ncbi:MAG: pantoate--beta-alanine ligase [Thermomicrobiales bacterium]